MKFKDYLLTGMFKICGVTGYCFNGELGICYLENNHIESHHFEEYCNASSPRNGICLLKKGHANRHIKYMWTWCKTNAEKIEFISEEFKW